MSRIKSRGACALGATLAIAALGVAATPAVAAEQAKTEVKVKRIDGSGASGSVSSKVDGCEATRKVTLYFLGDYVPVKVGKVNTKPNGKWKIRAELAPGRYYAKASKAKASDDGEKVKCKPDESKTARV